MFGAEIDVPSVTWRMIPGTNAAMVRLSQFSADATDDIQAAISEAEAAGATSLVLDLRSNPGGLLEQAISVTSQFLTDGNVLQQEDAEGNRTPYPVEKGGVAPRHSNGGTYYGVRPALQKFLRALCKP